MQKLSAPHTQVLNLTAQTTSVNSSKFNAGGYSGFVGHLNVTAASGTTPTLDVKFQDSQDGTNWVDIPSATFTQATATGIKRAVVSNVAQYLRAVATIAGTTPSFTFTVDVSGIN